MAAYSGWTDLWDLYFILVCCDHKSSPCVVGKSWTNLGLYQKVKPSFLMSSSGLWSTVLNAALGSSSWSVANVNVKNLDLTHQWIILCHWQVQCCITVINTNIKCEALHCGMFRKKYITYYRHSKAEVAQGLGLSPHIKKVSGLGLFCVEFPCSSCLCISLLQVLWFPHTVQRDAGYANKNLLIAHRCEVCEFERILSRFCPVIDWWHSQDFTCSLPSVCWDRL